MAVTAKFQADFSDFLRKAQQASGSLEDLQKAAGSTTSTVQRLAKSFSGESLIRNAVDSVEAVKMLGGTATLTEAEMKKLGAQLEQASQKMQRMGVVVPDAMRAMQSEIKKATDPTMFQRAEGALGKFGLSLGMVSAGALVAFGKAAINAADNVGDISEKTGLSVEAVQRFQQGFEGAGISLEEIAKSASKLSMQVAGGSDSTASALDALGLSMVDLRTKSPEEAFKLVAGALSKVDDQGKKTLLATELLGRGMGKSAGAFNEANISAMEHADILGGDAVDAAGDFNDAQTKLTRSLQNALLSGIGPMLPALSKLMEWCGALAGVIGKVLKFSIDGLTLSFNVMKHDALASLTALLQAIQKLPFASKIPGAEKLAGAISWMQAESKEASDAIAKHLNPALDKNAKGVETLSGRIGEYEDASKGAKQANVELDPTIARLTKSLDDQIKRYDSLKQKIEKVAAVPDWFKVQKVSLVEGAPIMARTVAKTGEMALAAQKAADSIGSYLAPSIKAANLELEKTEKSASKFSGALKGLGATIVAAFTGGGNPLGAIGSSLGGALGEDFGKAMTGKIGSIFGSAMGPLGSMLGGMAGSLLGKVGGWFRGLFGGDDKKRAEEAAAAVRRVAEEAARLEQKLAESREELAGFNDQVEGLIGKAAGLGYEINAQGEIVSVSFEKMRSLAQQYGVDLASLGGHFNQSQLSAAAAQIIADFELLTRGGADVGAVLLGMSDEIQKLVDDSIKFGTVIPENMRPMIQGLIEAGKLTDANGDKITDMAAIKFGDPVKTEFDKIVDALAPLIAKISELVDRIAGMGSAVDAATRPRTIQIGYQVDEQPDFGRDGERAAFGGGVSASGRIQRFALGGMVGGMGEGDNVPAMLTPGEGVLSRRGMQALGKLNHGGGSGGEGLRAELRGMREDMAANARTMRDLPRAIGLAMRDAMVLA